MKKLASLLTACSLGLFAIGCNETATGPEPAPGEGPAVEGGSVPGEGAGLVNEDTMTDEVPPVTDEPAPSLPAPGAEATPAEEATETEAATATEAAALGPLASHG